MKKFSKLIVAMIALLMLLVPVGASAQNVAVTRSDFNIVVNGRVVDNELREYPFILYNSITYFPMTYDDCAFLGVENNWTAASGNVITKTASSGIYRDFIDPTATNAPTRPVATIVNTPISVMGRAIDNTKEQYPILNYKNVLYFPLTWDWAQTFGWKVIFSDKNNFLEVSTDGFADSGYYYLYDNSKGSEISKNEIAKAYYGTLGSVNAPFSFSPEYTRESAADGYIKLYRLISGEDYEEVRGIGVRENMVAHFKQNGWFSFDEARAAVDNYAKDHSAEELANAFGMLPGSWDFRDIIEDAHYNYTTMYASDFRRCAVRNDQVAAYQGAGWMTGVDLYNRKVSEYLNKGDALSAMEFIQVQFANDSLGTKFPSIMETEYDDDMEKFNRAKSKMVSKMKGYFEFNRSYMNEDGDVVAVFNTKVPEKQFIDEVDLSYDIVDITGKVLNSVRTTHYSYSSNFESSGYEFALDYIEVSRFDYPTAYAIRNVKIHNVKLNSINNFPMGKGSGF